MWCQLHRLCRIAFLCESCGFLSSPSKLVLAIGDVVHEGVKAGNPPPANSTNSLSHDLWPIGLSSRSMCTTNRSISCVDRVTFAATFFDCLGVSCHSGRHSGHKVKISHRHGPKL